MKIRIFGTIILLSLLANSIQYSHAQYFSSSRQRKGVVKDLHPMTTEDKRMLAGAVGIGVPSGILLAIILRSIGGIIAIPKDVLKTRYIMKDGKLVETNEDGNTARLDVITDKPNAKDLPSTGTETEKRPAVLSSANRAV